MHVVAVVHAYLPHHLAGSERMMQELLAALVRRGHTATVLTTTQQLPDYTYETVNVKAHTKALQASLKPDVIVSHHNESSRAGQWARATQTPLVYVLNDNFPGNMTAVRTFKPALVVVNSRWLNREIGRLASPTLVVHPHVEPNHHRTTPGTKITLMNLSENKGAATFYQLATLLPHLEFLGIRGVYGRQLIRELPNVEHRDPTPDVKTIWADTGLLLMPSRYESYGLVAIEAAVNGIPTIAAPTPGLLESLSYAGTFVDLADIDGWVAAITSLQGPAGIVAGNLARHRAAELDDTHELTEWVNRVEQFT